eukprot:1160813-Pelagomonas_calceolata.AAC.18
MTAPAALLSTGCLAQALTSVSYDSNSCLTQHWLPNSSTHIWKALPLKLLKLSPLVLTLLTISPACFRCAQSFFVTSGTTTVQLPPLEAAPTHHVHSVPPSGPTA